ncbi:hypothetical protein CALCODRAFT_79571 [Calocera cornea HHB12733]|uniref:Uncharacterized protein n=1 Tax=Calocera cornea HHB12733 TaxID=1353952 RepID=A0A165DFD1_9BASI|nr:hypothetical protein CALCODRAFT_79571 [Calocera cornea HHB12733]
MGSWNISYYGSYLRTVFAVDDGVSQRTVIALHVQLLCDDRVSYDVQHPYAVTLYQDYRTLLARTSLGLALGQRSTCKAACESIVSSASRRPGYRSHAVVSANCRTGSCGNLMTRCRHVFRLPTPLLPITTNRVAALPSQNGGPPPSTPPRPALLRHV